MRRITERESGASGGGRPMARDRSTSSGRRATTVGDVLSVAPGSGAAAFCATSAVTVVPTAVIQHVPCARLIAEPASVEAPVSARWSHDLTLDVRSTLQCDAQTAGPAGTASNTMTRRTRFRSIATFAHPSEQVTGQAFLDAKPARFHGAIYGTGGLSPAAAENSPVDVQSSARREPRGSCRRWPRLSANGETKSPRRRMVIWRTWCRRYSPSPPLSQ
jgi:hypothetical protein